MKHHCAAQSSALLIIFVSIGDLRVFKADTESGVLEGYFNLQGLKRRPKRAQPYKGSLSEVCRKAGP